VGSIRCFVVLVVGLAVSCGLFKGKFLPDIDQRRSERVVRNSKCQRRFLLCLLKQLCVFTEITASKSMVFFVSRFGNSMSELVHTVFYCVIIILVTCTITTVGHEEIILL